MGASEDKPWPFWAMIYCLLGGYVGGLFCRNVGAPGFLGFICGYVCATQLVGWALKPAAKKVTSQ